MTEPGNLCQARRPFRTANSRPHTEQVPRLMFRKWVSGSSSAYDPRVFAVEDSRNARSVGVRTRGFFDPTLDPPGKDRLMRSPLRVVAASENSLRTVERFPLKDFVNLFRHELGSSNGAEPFPVQTVRDGL